MSLHTTAQNLAARGRNGDTMLVHMAPEEVGGLQALALAKGGSLTVNPDTGLVEAFKLRDILPMVAGFALGPAGFGLMGAGAAGLTVGGVEALRTGDLGRGLMAGLGAYGGAGLGTALTSAGASAPGAIASNLGVQGAATGAGSQSAMLAAQNAGFGEAGLEATRQAAATATGANMAPSLSNMQLAGQGASNLGSMQGISNLGTGLGQAFPSTMNKVAAATPVVMGISDAFAPKYEMPKTTTGESNYEGPYVPSPRDVRFKSPEDRSSSEFSYFNPSNPVPGFQPMSIYAQGGEINPDYNANINLNSSMSDQFAVGGLTALAAGGQGRFLQGPGDGTSDSIPAVIGNRQPARLADGEFVVDARTVSELGNGSSKAGAQKLYKMMDRIHGARKKVGRGQDSKAEKYLPA